MGASKATGFFPYHLSYEQILNKLQLVLA